MTQRIIISFCNNPARSSSQILCVKIPLNFRKGLICAPVSLSQQLLCVHATGLTKTRDRIYIAFISELGKQCIACLKKENLAIMYSQELPEVIDCHSILAVDNTMYLVSTGTDEVIQYEILTDSLQNPRIIWRASDAKKDTHHVNSIVNKGGNVLISAMGNKSSQLWSSALTGYIHDITRDVRVKEGISHPHSLSVRKGKIYYCNSYENTFCSVEEGALFNLKGYSRGTAWLSDTLVCMASSIGRKKSKSTGVVIDPHNNNARAGECMLIVGDVSSRKVVSQTQLSWFGPEVYDLLIFTSSVDPLELSTSAYLSERQAVQNQFLRIQGLVSQVETKNIGWQTPAAKVTEDARTIQELELQIEEKNQAIKEITNQVMERDGKLHSIFNSRAWKVSVLFRKIRAYLLPNGSLRIRTFNKLVFLLPFLVLHRRENISTQDLDFALVRNSGMFNQKWYLAHNPDVAQSSMDPLHHFIYYGGIEGRDPSPEFNSQFYLSSYDDVRKSGMNPLLHYLHCGKREGRHPNPNY